MQKNLIFILIMTLCLCLIAKDQSLETDTIKTSKGDLVITMVGHGSLMFTWAEIVIHVDPVSQMADYSQLPKADLILITHEHGDHLDKKLVKKLKKANTKVVTTKLCAAKLGGKTCLVMANGDVKTIAGIKIEAVPAYNILHKRKNGNPFHKKGVGNGYIMTLGDKRVYVAGDTENTPEMKALKDIDIAFLPMNLPYTMSPEMVADAARAFKPGILYPYHYGKTDTSKLVDLLKNEKEIEVRIRRIYPEK